MANLLLSLNCGILSILLVAAIPTILVQVKYSRVLYSWQHKRTQMERQSTYLGWMLTGDMFAKEIRLFNLGYFFNQWYLRIRQQLYKERLNIAIGRVAYFLAQYWESPQIERECGCFRRPTRRVGSPT